MDDELSLRLEALEAEIIQGKRAGVGDAASMLSGSASTKNCWRETDRPYGSLVRCSARYSKVIRTRFRISRVPVEPMKITGSGGVRVSALAAKKADDMVEARRQLTLYKLLETERNSVKAELEAKAASEVPPPSISAASKSLN